MIETPSRILVVDDEPSITEFVSYALKKEGYETDVVDNGEDAFALASANNYDLFILDIMLPGMDGYELCRRLRSKTTAPVLFLSARDTELDKVVGLEIGGDDYLAKPFLPKELLLRVGAILNRAYPKQNEMVELAGATVDMANAEVWKNGEKQTLTAKEMQLFEKLYQNAGRIVTTGILCETICGEFWQGYESTLSTHIRHLREKIEENPSKPVSLVTVKGLGYRLNLKEVSP